jgi:hypothetical protein
MSSAARRMVHSTGPPPRCSFAEDNFNDNGAEVRSLDQRDCKVGLFGDFCKVGLFGDFCERVGHGKFVRFFYCISIKSPLGMGCIQARQ